MNIRFKLLSMFLLIIAILLAETLAVWAVHFQLISEYRKLTDNLLTENTFTNTVPELIDTYYLFVLAPTSKDRLDDYLSQKQSINDALSKLDSEIVSDESKISYRGLKNVIRNIIENCDKGVESISAGDIRTASDYYNDDLNKKFYITENTANLMISELHYAENLQAKIDDTRNLFMVFLAAATAVISLSCVVLSLLFSKRMTQPISQLSMIADRIARNEKAGSVDKGLMGRDDEIGSLSRSFGIMTEKLKEKIQELQSAKDVAEKAKDEAEKSRNDLQKSNTELEHFNRLAIGRELKMVELKKKIKELEQKPGKD